MAGKRSGIGKVAVAESEVASAAAAAARAAGIGDDAIASALRSFAGVPHRLELVRERQGVRFVNDSKATNPEAAERALSAYRPRPVRLILGGSRKGASFDRLAAEARAQRVERAYQVIGPVGGDQDHRREAHRGLLEA